jgi:large subunit ribosomal protein L9
MKIILKADVDRVGKAGEVVTVAPGYARNYLLPRELAFEATERNMARIEVEKRRWAKVRARQVEEMRELATKLEALSLTIGMQVGENDRLFGTVTTMDVAAGLAKEGFTVDKRQITIEEPIKTLGIYTVPVRLHPEVTANLKVWVVQQ